MQKTIDQKYVHCGACERPRAFFPGGENIFFALHVKHFIDLGWPEFHRISPSVIPLLI